MLRQKLINLKLILRIVISCMVIFSMARSCAKAYTFDEFVEFCSIVSTLEQANANQKSTATFIVNNANNYKSKFSNGYTGFDSWVAWRNDYGSIRVFGYNGGHFSGWSNRNTYYIVTSATSTTNITYQPNSNKWVNEASNSIFMFCLFSDTIAENIDFTGYIGNQYYNVNPLSYTNMFSEDYSYNGETIESVTTSYSNNSKIFESVTGYEGMSAIRFELYNGNTSITNTYDVVTQKNFNNGFTFHDLGEYGTLTISTRLINLNTIYNLKTTAIINGEEYEIEEKVIFFPSGTTIENGSITYMPSGDFSYNIQDSTNDIINNQNDSASDIINSINNIVGTLPDYDFSGDASGDSSGFTAGSGILGGIFSLFVPDATYFKTYFTDLNNWFSARLGLLYFPIELTIDFLQRVLTIDFSTMQMSIGPYVLPFNDNYELIPEITIDFNEFLEDSLINTIHETYLLIIDGLIIFGLYRLIIKKYNEVIKNRGGV